MSGTRINPRAEDSGSDRVVCHGNTLSCWDEKNMACDSPPGDDVELEFDHTPLSCGCAPTQEDHTCGEKSRGIAYKSGWFDFMHGTVDEHKVVRYSGYAEGVADARSERADDEDRCSNGCVCTTVDRVVADNPQASVEEDDGDGAAPREEIYVKFVVRRDHNAQVTEPDQFLQYLVEMLELPQPIDTLAEEGYVVVGAHVYGIDS